MFRWVFGSSSKGKKESALPDSLAQIISDAGKASRKDLEFIASATNKASFVKFVRVPVLVGSAVQEGTIADKTQNEVKSTRLFLPKWGSEAGQALISEGLRQALYPLYKKKSTNVPGEKVAFLIGRLGTSDLVMPDYAISEKHAAIAVQNGKFLLKDLGSTNGTALNGTALSPEELVPLEPMDVISFARYEFSFLPPEALYQLLVGGS